MEKQKSIVNAMEQFSLPGRSETHSADRKNLELKVGGVAARVLLRQFRLRRDRFEAEARPVVGEGLAFHRDVSSSSFFRILDFFKGRKINSAAGARIPG